MIKVLVTGASGALGKALLKRLDHENGLTVFTTSRSAIKRPNHFIAELTDENQIKLLLEKVQPDYIFHLAATFTDDLKEAFNVNVKPSIEILDFLKRNSLKTKVLLIGSAAEYGAICIGNKAIEEMQALNPVSSYGISKAWQTQLITKYAQEGVNVKAARIFNLFGPNSPERTFSGQLNLKIQKILNETETQIELSSLEAIRDYISFDEASTQLMKVMTSGKSGEIYHVASGKPISMRDFTKARLKENDIPLSALYESHKKHEAASVFLPYVYADMSKTNRIFSHTSPFKK